MTGQQKTGAFLTVQALNQRQYIIHTTGIQTIKRFVQDNKRWLTDQCMRNRRAAAVAQRQLTDFVVRVFADAEQSFHLGGFAHGFATQQTCMFQALPYG